MPSQISAWIAMANTKATGKTGERVRELVGAGKCLTEGCDGTPTRRGLCVNCYYHFRKTLQSKSDRGEAAEFEERAIKAGKVLAVGMVRELTSSNPFAAV